MTLPLKDQKYLGSTSINIKVISAKIKLKDNNKDVLLLLLFIDIVPTGNRNADKTLKKQEGKRQRTYRGRGTSKWGDWIEGANNSLWQQVPTKVCLNSTRLNRFATYNDRLN